MSEEIVEVQAESQMACADEGFVLRTFLGSGSGDWICSHCGWMQISPAHGAAELCRSARWHSQAEYERCAAVARAGGIDVPQAPWSLEPERAADPVDDWAWLPSVAA